MLDMKFIRDHLDEVEQRLATRGGELSLAGFKALDGRRRALLTESETLKALKNSASEEIARVKDKSQVKDKIAEMKEVSQRIKGLDDDLKAVEEELSALLMMVPNLPHPATPLGRSEEDNVVVRTWGTPPVFPFEPKSHWEIGEQLGILDFERAAKLTGARFALYKSAGARLERALINFMLDLHTGEHGYTEVIPPFMVNRATMTGTGQLPKFEEDLFRIVDPDYFLIPTAEVPVTNIHRDEILRKSDLPISYTAHTPCFRREAGSYGKDTRGLIRQHQFNKVELVRFTHPDCSDAELEKLTAHAEKVLQLLELPYRVVALCSGDIGFSACRTYDLEVWLPGQGGYREISSCSSFGDFQARRAGIRFREDDRSKPEFVHTLNGSGLAVGRTVVAILENFQQADGSVVIPQALRPYMGGLERICSP
ncbi:serine--tRNA ligase [Trichlorobacter ammonificans]|uniref:Serine--tRNA ligase n=1 Tax=Trichlorobacter ammonificans TaxID=2916410 RepID=A0ABM9D3Z6_9BACT|nr:serine--tRNA ligase [Trichlorobacter ammonificans]CAH2029976.1 serine--tRNA ligase [Trichlorobacter ammonificans]